MLMIKRVGILALEIFAYLLAGSEMMQPAIAQTTIFDKIYVRSTGKPDSINDMFSLPPTAGQPFTFTIVNGNSDGTHRGSSGSVRLNGIQLVGPSTLKQTFATLTSTVSLKSTNTMSVELSGAPESQIRITIKGQVIIPPPIIQNTATVGESGGVVSIPDVGALEVPAGSVSSANITLATIGSPIITSLAQDLARDLDPTFALARTPQFRITSSAPFASPVQLRIQVPGTNIAGIPSFLALIRQNSEGEQIDTLVPIGGTVCGNTLVCATLLPGWFTSSNSLAPNETSIELGIGFSTSSATIARNVTPARDDVSTLTASAVTDPIRLWKLANLEPAGNDVTVSGSDDIPMSVSLIFSNPHILPPLSSVVVTSQFDFNRLRQHEGVDLRAADGTSVFNVMGGTAAIGTLQLPGYGTNIFMKHGGGNFVTHYAHLQNSFVTGGVSYSGGIEIAKSDTSGVTQPHLHFEVKFADTPNQLGQFIDPEPLLPGCTLDVHQDQTGTRLLGPCGVFPDGYALGLQFQVTVDGHIAALEDTGPNFTFNKQISRQTILSLLDTGAGPHKLELLLVSPKLGVHSLHAWNIVSGPVITQVNPSSGQQGQSSLNVAITGQSTHFAAGASLVNFGSGVTVGTVTVTDATHLTAQISIDEAASLGGRTVTVTTDTEAAVLANGFTVLAAAPSISSVNPSGGQQGQSNLNISITGQSTHFAAGTSSLSLGAGITVGTVTVTDATHLTAQISIDEAASLGGRTVTVTTGSELVALANGFTVAQGGNPAVRLNPFGNQIGAVPYNIEVVNSNLVLTPASQDITVTLLREVFSQCGGLLFSSNRTVVVAQGQSSATFNFDAGHDPNCNTLPITTVYTITNAVLAPSTALDLSGVPPQQLKLFSIH
jgi:hypothetical protein